MVSFFGVEDIVRGQRHAFPLDLTVFPQSRNIAPAEPESIGVVFRGVRLFQWRRRCWKLSSS